MKNLKPYETSDYALDNGFRNFYSMIDNFFNDRFTPEVALREASFKVDIQDKGDAYMVEAELPGFAKDEIKLTMDSGQLCIQAEKSEESNDEGKNYLHRERKTTSMSRVMYFENIDEDKLSAKLNDGILTIDIPKQVSSASNKKIEIQ